MHMEAVIKERCTFCCLTFDKEIVVLRMFSSLIAHPYTKLETPPFPLCGFPIQVSIQYQGQVAWWR